MALENDPAKKPEPKPQWWLNAIENSPEPEPHWWSKAKRDAPNAYLIAGIVGACWPFILVFIASLFSSGTQIGASGPKNWADEILMVAMILSYGGIATILLVYLMNCIGYHVGGYLGARIYLRFKSTVRST